MVVLTENEIASAGTYTINITFKTGITPSVKSTAKEIRTLVKSERALNIKAECADRDSNPGLGVGNA